MYYDNDNLNEYKNKEFQLKHDTCLYVVDHIYIDPATANLYHLFLHCDWCGKPIKLCVRTENDVVSWLGGKKGEWKVKTISTFPQYQHDEYMCPFCNTVVNYKTNYCPDCGAYMKGGTNNETIRPD